MLDLRELKNIWKWFWYLIPRDLVIEIAPNSYVCIYYLHNLYEWQWHWRYKANGSNKIAPPSLAPTFLFISTNRWLKIIIGISSEDHSRLQCSILRRHTLNRCALAQFRINPMVITMSTIYIMDIVVYVT